LLDRHNQLNAEFNLLKAKLDRKKTKSNK